jgi:UDP-GlcNAc:undecaprenyl-phosphate GlcNAc-1-phosphate transferase
VVRPSVLWPLVAATALGVADDRTDVPPSVRLGGEIAVGVLVVLTCRVHLGGLWATAALIAVTVVLINGVNMLDGLDMLASGVVAVAAVAFAVLTEPSRPLAVALAAALAAFLVYNRPPARIYLGDGGAYLLGTALTVLLAASWAPHAPDPRGVAALVVVALPAAEIAFAVVRRVRGHRSLLSGDRGHPYDRLVTRGWSPPAASLAYTGAEVVLATAAVIVGRGASTAAAVAVCVAAAVLLVVVAAVTGALAPDGGRGATTG